MEELPRAVLGRMKSASQGKGEASRQFWSGPLLPGLSALAFHFTQVPHPKGLSHALIRCQGPPYTHFENLPEAPPQHTHTYS